MGEIFTLVAELGLPIAGAITMAYFILIFNPNIGKYLSLGICLFKTSELYLIKEFWFVVEKILLGFDIGYWLEEALKFLSYEIPKESFKYLPIYFVLKSIWIKN